MRYIGIDNGVSGSIGISRVYHSIKYQRLIPTPVIFQQDYTKKKKNINRLDVKEFQHIVKMEDKDGNLAVIERPLVNPRMFNATVSAVRCLEAQLCILESLEIPYIFIDSKQWQKEMLPQGCKGKAQLKKASHDIGIRMFPQLKNIIEKIKDADGILIAEWARRQGL